MKIISWDVRGARRRGIYSQVRDLISIFNPDILVCMETRVNFGRALKIIKKNYDANFFGNFSVGFFGRDLVLLER